MLQYRQSGLSAKKVRKNDIHKKINRFLIISFVVIVILCVNVFVLLTLYLNQLNDQTVTQLGNIYMSSMNNRISKHFETMTEHRLVQMETMVETIPSSYRSGKEKLGEWLTYNGQARGFDSLSYCKTDGTLEMIYGDMVEPSSPEYLLETMERGERRIAIGYNNNKEAVVLICVPISIDVPGMDNCIGLVGELPISYISETLSLDEANSLIYSFVIRNDGSFVVRTFDAFRDNYFDRVQAIYEEVDGQTPEDFITELKSAMKNGTDYSGMVKLYGERRHIYCSSLPNSVWYLVTLMPYGALNESVETMGTRSICAALQSCAVILCAVFVVFALYFRFSHIQMKELEKSKKEAENASKAKSEFLSNMSHDIRTPMNAVVGMTAIATTHLDDPVRVGNCLKKITLYSKHLLGLINDVLDMSKIESGKMTLNLDVVSLRDVMEGIVNIIQPQVKSKNQKFNISIFDITSENVYCDSVRLNQIMLNLLSNATKFTPEGGSIDVVIREEASSKGNKYVRVQIYVKDSGIGMSREYQSHIFESFSREDNKRIHKIEGTGLGMAITKYIVDAMGGEITVSSRLGEGSEFHIVLDLERAEEQVEDMILPDWTMLVVDDDRQLCESTVESLQSIGIQAEWVLDGASAVQSVIRHHNSHKDFHIILLDWKMPGMDGIQTACELRRQLGDEVPILLMSAYDWSEIEDEARMAGISGFLMKPLFRSTLYYGLKPYVDNIGVKEIREDTEPVFSNKRILIAEDNNLNWEIACELLQGLGLELEWAENGKVCVDMFRKSQFGYYDAILMDIRMPVTDGYEATDIIRAMDRSDAKLPIIAMTADAYSEDIKRCLEHGMNAHIAKPIDIKEVARILKRYLST